MGSLSQNNGYFWGRWGAGDKSGAPGRGILILMLYFLTSAVLTWVLTIYSLNCTHCIWSVFFSYDTFHTHKDVLWEICDGYVPVIVQRKAVSVLYLIFCEGFCFCLNMSLTKKWKVLFHCFANTQSNEAPLLLERKFWQGQGTDYKQPQVNNISNVLVGVNIVWGS